MITRRNFIKIATGITAAGLSGCSNFSIATAKKRVIVIGGGAGGATAAKYIRQVDPSIDVTLIEKNRYYYTCFMSSSVLSGERKIDSIKFSYDGLIKRGIKVVHHLAVGIDPITKTVTTQNGDIFYYDRLIVSPGIDFKWDTIEGYDKTIAKTIPHAWDSGYQTITLRKQLEAMKDGGTVIITVPHKPFRCHPAPFGRASEMAQYLKQHKPKSKILILDANEKFAQQKLFIQGWKKLYGYGTDNSLIEWYPFSDGGGEVVQVDAKERAIYVGPFEDQHQADVINVIPAQKAGKIAFTADLVDETGWCPVNQKTFESKRHKDIHVIGDACIASPMARSAYAANSQAKVCAVAVVKALQGEEMGTPSYLNACYSIVGKDYGISVAAVYRLEGDKIKWIRGAGGLSPMDASAEVRKREMYYAHSWFKNITYDMFR
ncbi:MAG: cytochrome C [Gammaproteobacteria bacterium]|nr:MAG: cytochrome C [Gammaproteobacteria bacterium]RKZ40019.1 MAG: cytochrome C [Gammaproteobacteria bacterium]RKZ72659.1 MAG: cytochrome C [Gammaproteobacteria bacterium]